MACGRFGRRSVETCCWFTKSDGKSLVRLSTRSLSAGELLALQRLISISRARQLWGQCVDLHNVSDHIIMVLIIVIALMRIRQDGQHRHDVSRSGRGTHHRVSRAIWQEGIVWVSDSPARASISVDNSLTLCSQKFLLRAQKCRQCVLVLAMVEKEVAISSSFFQSLSKTFPILPFIKIQ